jgi:hypothetical protein
MLKELKYLFFILIIFIFFFLTGKYYFSEDNKKKSYRSYKEINSKIDDFSKKLILLKSDTQDIVIYVEKTINKNKKNYNFWKLLINNE